MVADKANDHWQEMVGVNWHLSSGFFELAFHTQDMQLQIDCITLSQSRFWIFLGSILRVYDLP
jgi:hypothetical protein